MRSFLIGIALATIPVGLVGVLTAAPHDPRLAAFAVTVACVLPLATAAAVIELVHGLRPRRVFVVRRPPRLRLLMLGIVVGVLGTLVAATGVALGDRWVPDVLIVVGSFVAVTAPTILALPRQHPGRCVYCAYDLRGVSTGSSLRCTECGSIDPIAGHG